MSKQYWECDADLDIFPEIQTDLNQVVIGDIHGNARYLLYLLIKFNVIELNDEQYRRLSDIYQRDTDSLTAADLKAFRSILKRASYHPNVSLLFLGDTLSDRGKNDYFTLCIFRRLASNQVPFTILLANHDFEFLACYERLQTKGVASFWADHIAGSQSSSITNLNTLLKAKICNAQGSEVFTANDLKRWVSSYLINHYKAIDYYLDDDGITIFSHAPIDVSIILGIAKELGVDHCDDSAKALATTIDNINLKVSQLMSNNQLCNQFTGIESGLKVTSKDVDPLTRLIWNRDYDSLDLRPTYKGYQINYVHGHDSHGIPRENVTSLDKKFGKSSNHTSGTLHFMSVSNNRVSFFNGDGDTDKAQLESHVADSHNL